MGSALSSVAAPPRAPPKRYLLSWPEEDFPEEASTAPEDTRNWYCEFFETLFCIPHKDGQSILIVEPPDNFTPDSRARPGWAHKRLKGAYELLGAGHPRIVRYLGPVKSGNGVLVERLWPGPILWHPLPLMTMPLPREPSHKDRVMLCLNYRWALQILSALKFAHTRSVYIRNFCSQLVWLRSDFSIAITGFMCSSAPDIEKQYKRDAMEDERERKRDRAQPYGSPPYDPAYDPKMEGSDDEYFSSSWSEGELIIHGTVGDYMWAGETDNGCVEEDLYYWAVFMQYLMSNIITRSTALDANKSDKFEDARLGTVLANALESRFQSADKVMELVKVAASQIGISVMNDDEVDIGNKWENLFEIHDQRLCFREQM